MSQRALANNVYFPLVIGELFHSLTPVSSSLGKYAVFLGSLSCCTEVGDKNDDCGDCYDHYHFSLPEASHYWISKSTHPPGSQRSGTEWPLGFFSITLLIHASRYSLLPLSVKRTWSRASGCSDTSVKSLMETLTSNTEPGHDKLVSNIIRGLTLLHPP